MLAICCLCATLSKEELLIATTDKSHNVVQQLKHCFKFEIESNIYQAKNYVCSDCIKTLDTCDAFYRKIERAQESLRILFKAKSQSNAEKSAKKAVGIIRTRDFCKIQNWQNHSHSEPTKDSATETNSDGITRFSPIEENNSSCLNDAGLTEIKVECEDDNEHCDIVDPLEMTTNCFEMKANEQTADQSLVFENLLRDVLNKANDVEDNHESIESSASEANFMGFDEPTFDEVSLLEEHSDDETFDELENWDDQIKVSMVRYQCETCAKDFPNEETLQKHLNNHKSERAFGCKECPKVFHHQSSLYYHMRKHRQSNNEEGVYKCTYCAKAFHRLDSLKIHLRTHSAEKNFQCKICLKTMRHSSSLWYHMKSHKNDRQYSCQFCSKAYFRRVNLENHLIAHQKKRLSKCKICDKTFCGEQKLQQHIEVYHTERVFKCAQCTSSFSTQSGLANHSKLHSDSQYTCEYCYKEFRSLIWYNTHLRTHSVSARAQFKCASCAGTFLNQRSLTAHTCDKMTEK